MRNKLYLDALKSNLLKNLEFLSLCAFNNNDLFKVHAFPFKWKEVLLNRKGNVRGLYHVT